LRVRIVEAVVRAIAESAGSEPRYRFDALALSVDVGTVADSAGRYLA